MPGGTNALLTVLIVDDKKVNREILKKILSTDYETLEAENGQEALEMLDQHEISAVLLDIVMPVMDGYIFLQTLPETTSANLPVIVMTGAQDADSEQRALDLGAWDFVSKPYQAKVLKSRLRNAIARSQIYLLDRLKYINEHDALTGLFNRAKYFEETRRMLDEHPGCQFACICFDIDQFHVLNSFWGEQEGNRFLMFLAGWLRDRGTGFPWCTYGRIEADTFSMCEPYDEEMLLQHVKSAQREIADYNRDYLVRPTFGVYVIDDPNLSVDAMYARAAMASRAGKNKYEKSITYYRAEMSEAAAKEQRIVNEMQHALEAGQFVPYFQPKYNLKTQRPYGAEALIRWLHPERGMISPGEFIPVFERNGFIGKVDYFMWESVCRLLRKWLDAGEDPAPISVNVSRVDMYNPNLVGLICGLVKKYRLPPALLNLELTESAYMESPEIMKQTVESLQKEGFTIMMDDFGSGYSSLNSLKDIPVDVLKIDMKFLESDGGSGRGERVLASVIHMAGWLELPVIVEGVETAAQREFLQSLGCGYAQGYYYARPMPVEQYEELVRGDRAAAPVVAGSQAHKQMSETLWSTDPQVELLFDSITQPVGVFGFDGTSFTALRVNKQFRTAFGYGAGKRAQEEYLRHVSPETLHSMTDTFREAAVCGGEASCDYLRLDEAGDRHWVHMNAQYWGSNSDTKILFAMFEDTTSQRQFEELQHFPTRHSAAPRKKMLIIEDYEPARAMLCQTFGQHYELLEAADGRQGLEILRAHAGEIGVILLDFIMSVMDGPTFLQVRNQDPALARIPVVAIATDNTPDCQMHMLEMGVNDYVTKPFVPEILRRRVENALEYKDRFCQLRQEYRDTRGEVAD